nr:EOG090X0BCY [Triops cancriformis]
MMERRSCSCEAQRVSGRENEPERKRETGFFLKKKGICVGENVCYGLPGLRAYLFPASPLSAFQDVHILRGKMVQCCHLNARIASFGLLLNISTRNRQSTTTLYKIAGYRTTFLWTVFCIHKWFKRSCGTLQTTTAYGKVTGGLTMNLLESTGQTSIFAYEHNKDYQKIQMQFLQAVESLNPENIAAVVNAHPHHIDSLLQLSDICRMGEDIQTATELIERALYCLELAFHPSFNVAQGKCRLEYRRQENRALFLALFKHLTYIGQKGCYRTALEFCKLLYNLDPEADPLAVQLMIDFYAVRAQEQDWLIRFYHQFESVKNFSQLPNMAYSIAAAYFGKHRTERDPSDLEKANQYLQEALIMFPGVLQPLLDKCSIQADPRVAKHEFFGIKAMSTQTPALEQLIQLYVGRSYHVWKEPDLLPWLEQNAHAVLERVDDKDPHVVDCEEKRKKRYQGMPRNIYRHIIMSEIKDATATLPPNLAEGPLMTFDPLPPADSINSYSVTRTASTTQENDGSLLSVFLRSLMPGYNVVEPRGAAGVGGAQGHLDAAPAAEEVQEAPNEFRNATMDVSRTCAAQAGLDFTPINQCQNSLEGQQLLHDHGVETLGLSPKVTFIPWIIFNGVYDDQNEWNAQLDFKTTTCNNIIGDKPAACFTARKG